ncbi:hypothetical protein [Streptomyces sp. CRN 30]|uniref:hypothetical protein n=1 Tax=Streptomyces sp. CRN 30 TaxID=3075613 RepID=UPI002A8300E9|nr:hypothetical protein [Streptomyces sp. CRN 30]
MATESGPAARVAAAAGGSLLRGPTHRPAGVTATFQVCSKGRAAGSMPWSTGTGARHEVTRAGTGRSLVAGTQVSVSANGRHSGVPSASTAYSSVVVPPSASAASSVSAVPPSGSPPSTTTGTPLPTCTSVPRRSATA